MAEVASAYVSLMPSARGFGRGIDSQISGDIDASGKRAGSRFGGALKAGAIGALAGLGIAAAKILGDSISAASDAQQAVGGVQAVFGKYADSVLADSKKAAQGLGLSTAAYNELITVSGAMLKNKGLKDFAAQSKNLIGVGADLSAMFGGTTKEAVDALNAAMRGESDPIERYGISLNATAVEAEAVALGLAKNVKNLGVVKAAQNTATLAQRKYNEALKEHGKGSSELLAAESTLIRSKAALKKALAGEQVELTNTQRAQAALSLIQKQSADAQGAFGRESDTLAGQQQRLAAQWENMKIELGTGLLPVLTRLVGWINSSVLPALSEVGGIVKGAVGAFRSGGAEAGKFGAAMQIIGVYAQHARQLFEQNIGPIKDIVQGIATIVAELWRRFGDIWLSTISGVLRGIRNVIGGVLNVIAGIVKVFAGILTGDWRQAWEGVKQIVSGAVQIIRGVVGALVSVLVGQVRTMGRAIGEGFAAAWNGAVSATMAGVGRVTEFVRSLPGRIVAALGSLGSILYNAGRELIQGLIDGIVSKAADVGSAMAGIAGKVKGFLPGSPVKEGPLTSWNNGGAGKRLAGLLVDGLDASQADVARAAGNLARRAEIDSNVKVRASVSRYGDVARTGGALSDRDVARIAAAVRDGAYAGTSGVPGQMRLVARSEINDSDEWREGLRR